MKQLKDNDTIKVSSDYIGFLDVMDRTSENPVTLTIADVFDVSGEKIDGMREAKLGTYALSFNEIPNRKLLLQGRKKKFIMRNYGKRKSDLIGKTIKIYGDPNVMFAGKAVGGVKIVGQD